jgi:hypothetical protein
MEHEWIFSRCCECCQSDHDLDYHVVDGLDDAAVLCLTCFESITKEQEK